MALVPVLFWGQAPADRRRIRQLYDSLWGYVTESLTLMAKKRPFTTLFRWHVTCILNKQKEHAGEAIKDCLSQKTPNLAYQTLPINESFILFPRFFLFPLFFLRQNPEFGWMAEK